MSEKFSSVMKTPQTNKQILLHVSLIIKQTGHISLSEWHLTNSLSITFDNLT